MKKLSAWARVFLCLLFVVLQTDGLHAKTGPLTCVENGGSSLCIKSELAFSFYFDSTPRFSETQGDAACRAFEFSRANQKQTNARWEANHPKWGPTCTYDFCEFATIAGETSPRWHCSRIAAQGWVNINQWCPDLGGYRQVSVWTDTQDTYPDVRGRNYCTYEVPTVDLTCPIYNPVQPGFGVKVLSEMDMPALGPNPLPLVRHYRSVWPQGLNDGLAPQGGWRLPWHAQLSGPRHGQTTKWANQVVQPVLWVVRPSGRVELFRMQAGGGWKGVGNSHVLDDTGASIGERWMLKDSTTGHVEYYDGPGRLSRVIERTGITTVQRDATGRVQAVVHSTGQRWEFSYSEQTIQTVTGPGGLQVRYGYAGKNLTLVQVGAGTTAAQRYHYEDTRYPLALTGISDPSGSRLATYTYDYSSGKVSRTEGVNGAGLRVYSYGPSVGGEPGCQTTGPIGTDLLQFSDVNFTRRLASATLANGARISETRDGQARLVRQTTADQTVVFYEHNAQRLETQRAIFSSQYVAQSSRPPLSQATAVVSTQWHPGWNLPAQIAEPGRIRRYTYDGQGNAVQELWWPTADPTGAQGFAAPASGPAHSRETQYNANNRPVSIVRRSNSVVQHHWTYGYDNAGQLVSLQDQLTGETATLSNHVLGMPTRVVSSSGAQAMLEWSSQGQLLAASHADYSVRFQYDNRQWLTGIDLGSGRTIQIGYDAQGNITQVQDNTGLAKLGKEPVQNLQLKLQGKTIPLALSQGVTGGLSAATGGTAANGHWQWQAQCDACGPQAAVQPATLQQGLQPQLMWTVLVSATVMDAAQGLMDDLLTYSASKKLADNMQCKTDAHYQAKPDDGCTEPHHIVPYADGRFPSAIQARAILAEVGIDLNSAANGVWVECGRHRRMHNGRYYDAVRDELTGPNVPRTKVGITEALDRIRKNILDRTLPGSVF